MPTARDLHEERPGGPIGYFYAWWQGDGRPDLPTLPELTVGTTDDARLMAELASLPAAEVRARLAEGHRAYLGWLGAVPVAYGWSARHRAAIGELGLVVSLRARQRYLWDFATLPTWRGRGLYPRLLQAILVREAAGVDQFWIGHDRDNAASERGIVKAGFGRVGALHLLAGGRPVFRSLAPADRARAAARILGASLLEGDRLG